MVRKMAALLVDKKELHSAGPMGGRMALQLVMQLAGRKADYSDKPTVVQWVAQWVDQMVGLMVSP
jgi:hypothetical protein